MEQTIDLKQAIQMLQDPVFDRVLVACHRSPDGDACGSAHALSYALRKMGKEARVFCPDPFGEEFSYLTSEEQSLPDFEPAHFITVDVAAPDMLCSAPFANRVDLVLDHHRVNSVCGKVKIVLPQYAACAELVAELIFGLGLSLDPYLAAALYTGIATDTGCFRYSNVREHTFSVVAKLYAAAPEGAFYDINKKLFETKSRLQIALEGFAAASVRFAAGGALAYLAVSRRQQKELSCTYSDLDCLINVIRQIEGVQVSLVAKEREAGEYKVSVRSEKGFDACEFCAAFGGGGHIAAAGCTLHGRDETVIAALLAEAERRLS